MRLSIVMAGRNDLYGGGEYARRMNQCLASVVPIGCEIIFVEWNPPSDRPPIQSVIEHSGVRIITVPSDVHDWQHGSEMMPMFEYRAKNVGIRRAKGDWILVINSDIQLMETMRQRLKGTYGELAGTRVYGAKRHDVHLGTVVQVCDGPGDFVLMQTHWWHHLRGYLDLVSYTHIDSLLWWTAEQSGFEKCILDEYVIHEEHDRSDHKMRWGIHSSDMPRFIGQRNAEDWGLRDVQLPEVTT